MKEGEIEKGDCGPPIAGEGAYASSAILFEDGPVVYPTNAFDSRLLGDLIGTTRFKSDKISKKK